LRPRNTRKKPSIYASISGNTRITPPARRENKETTIGILEKFRNIKKCYRKREENKDNHSNRMK
jgi:hypothetical protein